MISVALSATTHRNGRKETINVLPNNVYHEDILRRMEIDLYWLDLRRFNVY